MTDASFLAPPDEVLDWRRVILTAAAIRTGLFAALPGTELEVASRSGQDSHSTRVLLDALTSWDVVERADHTYTEGSAFPSVADQTTIQQHARFMQRWGGQIDARIADRMLDHHPPRSREALESWLSALAVNGREKAPDLIERCLQYFPNTASVLDVAGGHGEYGIEAGRRGCEVTLLDIPEVIEVVSRWPSIAQSNVTVLGADVYEAQPIRHDMVLVFGFTHTQPRGKLGDLFKRIFEMTSPGGGIAVHTFLRDSGPVPALFAVQMLLTGRGGDTHSIDDYTTALTNAGFAVPQVDDLVDRSLLLARRPAL